MKQTLQVNIGSRAFTLDEDAYDALRAYFADIRNRLPEAEAAETMSDLETHMGEILGERVGSLTYVVSIDLVRAAINRLGTPDCFGKRPETAGSPTEAEAGTEPRKLLRSRDDRMIAGVCGGLAAYLKLDPAAVRLATPLLCVLFGGTFLLAYAIFWIVVPTEPQRKFAPPFGRKGAPATDR